MLSAELRMGVEVRFALGHPSAGTGTTQHSVLRTLHSPLWRERVGIEPTGAAGGVSIAVLKTGRTTRSDPPPGVIATGYEPSSIDLQDPDWQCSRWRRRRVNALTTDAGAVGTRLFNS